MKSAKRLSQSKATAKKRAAAKKAVLSLEEAVSRAKVGKTVTVRIGDSVKRIKIGEAIRKGNAFDSISAILLRTPRRPEASLIGYTKAKPLSRSVPVAAAKVAKRTSKKAQ